MNLLAVLPLAVVMVAGLQIISAVLIATSQHARRTSVASVAFVAGVALAITVGTMVAYWLTGLVETSARSEGQGTVGTVIDWLVIVLLVVMLVRVFRRAEEHHPAQVDGPAADRRCAAAVPAGLLLVQVMPTDLITMFTVGAYLARHHAPWWHSLPFLLLTLLLAGLPLLVLLLLGRRARCCFPGCATG